MGPLFRRTHQHAAHHDAASKGSAQSDAKVEASPTKSTKKGKEPLIIVDTSRRHLPPPSDLLHYVPQQASASHQATTNDHAGYRPLAPPLSTPVSPMSQVPPSAATAMYYGSAFAHGGQQSGAVDSPSAPTGSSHNALASEVDPFARDVGQDAGSSPRTMPNSPVRGTGRQSSPVGTKQRLASSPEDRILRDLYLHRHDSVAGNDSLARHPSAEASGSSPRSRPADLDVQPSSKSPKLGTEALSGGRQARSPRQSRGSRGARMETAEEAALRRKMRADKASGKRSPSSPTLGGNAGDSAVQEEEPDDRPASSLNPGMVLGDFGQGFSGGLDLNGPMDDILDPLATRTDGRHGSTSGPAQPNIAPWLMEDTSSANGGGRTGGSASSSTADIFPHEWNGSETVTPAGRRQSLNHFSSIPALPKLRRQGTVDALPEYDPTGPPSRGSQAEIFPIPGPSVPPTSSDSSTRDSSRSRHGSGDSAQTLSLSQARRPKGSGPELGQSRHASIAGPSGSARIGRFGSAGSNPGTANPSVEKKKGLFGLLKRKNTNAASQGTRARIRSV